MYWELFLSVGPLKDFVSLLSYLLGQNWEVFYTSHVCLTLQKKKKMTEMEVIEEVEGMTGFLTDIQTENIS